MFRRFCSMGKSKVNKRNAEGIIPDVAKLILPDNNRQNGSSKEYAARTLNIQPAHAQESSENVKFTCLWAALFKKTKMPSPTFASIANNSVKSSRNDPSIKIKLHS